MKYDVWHCKIIVERKETYYMADSFPRRAAIDAIEKDCGRAILSCFSGWGDESKLTEDEVKILKSLTGRKKAEDILLYLNSLVTDTTKVDYLQKILGG